MARNPVAITGIGVLSPIGLDLGEVEASIASMRSGIVPFEAPPLKKIFPAGVVQARFEDRFTPLELPFLDRCQQLAIVAADQAIAQSGLDDFAAFGGRAGVYYGNVNGGASTGIAWSQQLLVEGKQAARPFTAMAIMGNAGAAQIAIRHKVHGPVITNASACGSSGIAIGDAARAIADGYLDIAVAGGAEAPLSHGILSVFDGTRALARPDESNPAASCKPFALGRTGLVLGEGAAFVVLESVDHARRRGAVILGYLTGYGVWSDATHIGMPDAQGQMACLRAALASAGLSPSDIGYINAHATATKGGDIIEANAIRGVFGTASDAPPVSSTKSVHGHLLGATSALEFIVTLIGMRSGLLPATLHTDGGIDPRCALTHVGPVPREARIRHALTFSCGFGGTNVALIVSFAHHPA